VAASELKNENGGTVPHATTGKKEFDKSVGESTTTFMTLEPCINRGPNKNTIWSARTAAQQGIAASVSKGCSQGQRRRRQQDGGSKTVQARSVIFKSTIPSKEVTRKIILLSSMQVNKDQPLLA
jgi:hypothetical protein